MSSTDHEEPQTCPVCQQQGWLLCGVEVSATQYEYDDEGMAAASADRTAYPFGFECPVCKLDLDAEQLGGFDFPSEFELEPDDNPPLDWEPDEDYFRDR